VSRIVAKREVSAEILGHPDEPGILHIETRGQKSCPECPHQSSLVMDSAGNDGVRKHWVKSAREIDLPLDMGWLGLWL
jgi:hypothetical protein